MDKLYMTYNTLKIQDSVGLDDLIINFIKLGH